MKPQVKWWPGDGHFLERVDAVDQVEISADVANPAPIPWGTEFDGEALVPPVYPRKKRLQVPLVLPVWWNDGGAWRRIRGAFRMSATTRVFSQP